MESNIGKKVIIRGSRSGVEFGELVAQNGSEVTLKNARRIWYWDGAASLSQLAKDGTTKPSNCKSYFTYKKKLENIKYALFYLTLDIGRLEEICNQEDTKEREDYIKYLIGIIKDTTKKYYNG